MPISEDKIIKRGIRDLCGIGLFLVLVLMALVFLASWGIGKVKEKPRFVEPKVIVNGPKYYPRPYYPEKKVTQEVIERASYEVLY